MSTFCTLLENKVERGELTSLTFTHSKLDGKYLTLCKFTMRNFEYRDVFIAENIEESTQGAAKRAFLICDGLNKKLEFPKECKPKECNPKECKPNTSGTPIRENKKITHKCEGICRCLHFHGLDGETKLSDVTFLCRKYGKVSGGKYIHVGGGIRFICVFMKDHRDADDIVINLDDTPLDGKFMTVIKGCGSRENGLKNEPKNEPNPLSKSFVIAKDPYAECDKFVLPPRGTVKKSVTKEELDKELDDYMHGESSGGEELDKKIDEYMAQRNVSI